MKTFRRIMAALAGLGLAATMAACAEQPSSDPEPGDGGSTSGQPLTIGLTYTPNIQFAAFYLAESKGYFEEAGLDVELRHHGQSEELFGALENGTEQLVFAGGDEIVQARSAGIDVTSVAQLYREYPAALIVPADSPIQSAADLKGRTIGTPGPYGQTYAALLAMLSGAGLAETDLTVEHIGYTQQAALTGGKVDGVMGYSNNDAVQIERSGFPVRVIPAFPEGEAQLVGPSMGASGQVIAERGGDIRAALMAVERATDDLIADPQAAVEASAEFIPTLTSEDAKASALATLEATIPLLAQGSIGFPHDHAAWTAMIPFMAEHGLLSGPAPALDEVCTDQFLPMM